MKKVRCGKCGKKVPPGELDAHWNSQHNNAADDKMGRSEPPGAEHYLPEPIERWTTCPTCGVQVKESNYKKHRKKAHKTTPTKADLKAEKKRQSTRSLRDYDGHPDFLDLPNVVSGGGFGVGRGKKK